MSENRFSMAIAVVIVNYKTAQLVNRALDSLLLEREFLPQLSVIVVDNDSPDDSLAQLHNYVSAKQYGDWVHVFSSGKNGGYAYGNNVGFEKIESLKLAPEYIWMLNPDTYLRPKAGYELVAFLQQHPHAIAGSRLEDADTTPQVSTFNFPSVLSEVLSGFGLGALDKLFHSHRIVRDIVDNREEVDWLAGASMMIPSQAIALIGGLDERYFLYFEEVDYCLAMRKAEYHCWYVPESRVVHEVGASTGISDIRGKQPRRPQYWFESRRYYFGKNLGPLSHALADVGWMLGYTTWILRKKLTASKDLHCQPPHLLGDFWRNSVLNLFSRHSS